jgi:hypothetical protein
MTYVISALAGVMLVMGIVSWFLFKQYNKVQKQLAVATVEVQARNAVINYYSNNLAETIRRVEFVQRENFLISSNATAKNAIFERHDLNYLAKKKAGLIETRINAGTQKAFDSIENLTDPRWIP